MSDENYRCMHVWLDLFFIIKATCNSCACFGWDTQACIQAIGTRDVSSEWISKYVFDLEQNSISTSTKTRGLKSKVFFPSPWVGEPHLDQGYKCLYVYFKAIQLWKQLSCHFDWQQLLVHKPIQYILYFFNFDCLCDQLLVHNCLQSGVC